MTTELRALLAVALLALGCADMHETRRGDSVDVSSYPPDIQQAYRVFALRCSRCHTLARPLNARITDPQHWIRYVARMRRQPGSGIDHSNADLILKFLLFYHRAPSEQPSEPTAPSERKPPPPPVEVAPEPPPPAPAAEPEPAPEPPLPPELPQSSPNEVDTTGASPDAPQGGYP